ncbi:phosphate ABC transporter permease PstA [Stappia sp. GBMRC 2046]|uniref:Phosphate transport system permease protein PstA n=1 Tax=Stappia sediminis TaxID=2692190 RepID=A0A7X3LVT7_9HYPH|nr:phosphate ABC transporter permease PstA [Stappia sediminis]
MTEIAHKATVSPAGDLHTSVEAKKRLARRYSAEARFKAYGIGAIGIAGLFLVLLLSTIISQGLPAFTFNYVSLPIDLSVENVDPSDPQAADYNTIVRDALKAELPFASDRRNRRVLYSLVSSGANIVLRNEVLDDVSMLGTEQARPIPLSDFADLYVKGMITTSSVETGQGIASPVGTEGTVRILSTSNDFHEILAEVKAGLGNDARGIRAEIEAKQRSVRSLEASIPELERRVAEADGPTKRRLEERLERNKSSLASVRAQIESLSTQAENLEQRATAVNQSEQLTTNVASYLVEINGGVVKVETVDATMIEGTAYIPLQSEAAAAAGDWRIKRIDTPESSRKFSDQEIAYTDYLAGKGLIESKLNTIFFTSGASREPEMAGIWGAVVGSFYTMLVTLALSFPIGVAAAIYLEEFAPKNRITHLIEVNINNLAAVPSIVFGLLGLAVFLNVFGLPRSAPLVGGMVLALMTLPTIIIAARAALKAVPPSIREAALGIGASKIQTVFHHVLPLAMPGIFTGTIIGMAQALGETAPLLMIGMVAFIVDIPGGPLDPSTVLPVQIYMWADFPEPAFQQKTSAAIMVLLAFLILMNAIAIILRKRFERRW